MKLRNKEAEAIINDDKSIPNIERFAWVSGALTVMSIISYWFFEAKYTMFILPFALAFTFVGVLIWLFLDWKLIPGDSIAKIGKDGLSSALFAVFIGICFSVGVSIGEKVNVDRVAGEAQQQVEKQLDDINKRLDAKAPEKPTNEDWDKGNTR